MIRVVKPGALMTIQDLGRPGLEHWGVAPAGAADALALRAANLLLGNPEGAPAIEMSLVGPTLEFTAEHRIAITGGDAPIRLFHPSVDQPQARPVWAAFGVRAGQQLEIGALTRGARLYLAVQGGIVAERPLGSASTHRPSKLGPALVGRGAQIRACTHPEPGRFHPLRRLFASVHLEAWREAHQAGHIDLRMTPGPDFSCLTDETAALLTGSVFAVHADSDRIALRFTGPALPVRADLPSRALPLGAVQVDPAGALFIMGVDAPTTGNYPILGSVVSADLWKLGQMRAGDAARLRFVTQVEAEDAMRTQEDWLASVAAKPR